MGLGVVSTATARAAKSRVADGSHFVFHLLPSTFYLPLSPPSLLSGSLLFYPSLPLSLSPPSASPSLYCYLALFPSLNLPSPSLSAHTPAQGGWEGTGGGAMAAVALGVARGAGAGLEAVEHREELSQARVQVLPEHAGGCFHYARMWSRGMKGVRLACETCVE